MSSTPETPDAELPPFEFKIDPDFVQMATSSKLIYDAHVDAGFTPDQAIQLTVAIVSALSMSLGMSTE